MNVENNNDNNSSKTVTSVISRSIKPGYEKDYDDRVQRYLALERKALGYLGTDHNIAWRHWFECTECTRYRGCPIDLAAGWHACASW